jgi:hypothetical protein
MEEIHNKQRVVNKKLGKNITKDHLQIYDEIEKNIGKTKKCNFGNKKGSKTGVKHEGCMEVPIREFELRYAHIINNNVIIEKGDGLQGFCKNCSKRRRQARISNEKEEKKYKTAEEIYNIYIKKYGKKHKKCSRCNNDKKIDEFNLSISMECGLHNMCKNCCYEYGNSVGNRWIIYMPDGNYKYNKKNKNEHDDHIFPLSLGGSNELINHQILNSTENLKKSNGIQHFINIENINHEQLSVRFRKSLTEAKNLDELNILLQKCVYNDILERSKLNDEELYTIYNKYCETNNKRCNVNRAVKKFREYCNMRFNV